MFSDEAEDRHDEEPAQKKSSACRRVAHFVLREMGVSADDLADFGSFTRLLHSPRDPSGLAVTRMLFGESDFEHYLLMYVGLPQHQDLKMLH